MAKVQGNKLPISLKETIVPQLPASHARVWVFGSVGQSKGSTESKIRLRERDAEPQAPEQELHSPQ